MEQQSFHSRNVMLLWDYSLWSLNEKRAQPGTKELGPQVEKSFFDILLTAPVITGEMTIHPLFAFTGTGTVSNKM